MNAELWATIKRLHGIEKLSRAAIAEKLRIHRWTVRRALKSVDGPPRETRGAKPRASKLDAFKEYLAERLRDYPRLSAAKLFDEIRAMGYQGGDTILREYLNSIRPPKREVFLRVETPEAEQAQIDWANCGKIVIGNTARKLSCFVMVLSFSRMTYLEFTLSQSVSDFIQCHINAFRFFGGVVKKCLYDNLKAVCLYRNGSLIKFNERFMEFAGVFSFEPVLCNVARGNEKGKVEKNIRYIRENFLEGKGVLQWPKINDEAWAWRDQIANVRVHQTTRERPVERFEREKSLLLPLPDKDFDCSLTEPVKASSQALIRFDGNAYTLPHVWAHKKLTLKATPGEVKIWDAIKLLAVHARSYERGVVIEDPKHEAGLLAVKKQAQAAKTKDRFLALGPEAERYLEGLMGAELNVGHHLAKIAEFCHLYGKEEVLGSIRHALVFNAFGSSYIQNILLQQRAARGLPTPQPITIASKPEWTKITVEEPDLALYDDLFNPDMEKPLP